MRNKTSIIKNIPKSFKILLGVFMGMIFLVLSFKIGFYVYCHTVAICDSIQPTMSSEMISTEVAIQYEMAIKYIDIGHYEIAKEHLEYIIYHDPEYKDARKKLLEVEELLELTPTP